ncbi:MULTISPECIES: hypothetical protein [Streptomyces]|uniref:hypothetical protein n=1 Tax=Streptomyces TaxID=1883 RepID=UPI00341CCA34
MRRFGNDELASPDLIRYRSGLIARLAPVTYRQFLGYPERRLFSGPSSLHRLASLELLVRPFDFREAARFWGIRSPRLAVQVHAVVGGTPAYRGDLVCDDAPTGPRDFDAWVCRTVLNPRTGRCPIPRWSRSQQAAPRPVRSPNASEPS